jgi:hypothetical protein
MASDMETLVVSPRVVIIEGSVTTVRLDRWAILFSATVSAKLDAACDPTVTTSQAFRTDIETHVLYITEGAISVSCRTGHLLEWQFMAISFHALN